MLRSRLLIPAVLASCLAPTAAEAGTPFTVGQGSEPHIAMVPGTDIARAVWKDDVAKTIHFCAIPRGATACSLERVLPKPPAATSLGAPFVVNTASAKVHVAVQDVAGGRTFLYTSINGGLNWSSGAQIYSPGSGVGTGQSEPVFNAAGDELLFASTNPDRFVHAAKTDGSESATSAVANLVEGGQNDLRDLQVARLGGTALVGVAHNGTKVVYWRLGAGNPSAAASWGAGDLVGDGTDARLSGSGSPWLMATAGPIGARRIEVRQYADSDFGPMKVLANEDGRVNDIEVNGGAVGAIWRQDGPSTDRLRLSTSSDGGTTFSKPVSIAFEDAVMASMDLALATDAKGFAIYEGSGDTGSGAKRFIHVASTDALSEPTPAPAGGTETAPPPATTTSIPPKTAPASVVAVKPPVAAALVRRIAAKVDGATLSLGVPTGCIPAGKPFVATLSFKKQKRKGNVFVKVTRTDFFVGAKRLKIDRSAPFRQTLRIPSPKAGQSYGFRARAFIKVRRGIGPKKSVRATLKVCG